MRTTPESRLAMAVPPLDFERSHPEAEDLLADFNALWEYARHLLRVHEDRTPEMADRMLQNIDEDYKDSVERRYS